MTRRIADELHDATRALRRAGHEAAEHEARVLWAGLAGLHPAQVWIVRDGPATADLAARYRAAVERRAEGEPLAYIVGTAGFRRLELMVDRRVLIPRPETEELVEHVLRWARERFGPGRSWGPAADVGTGCGCIALSLAVEGRFDRIVATEYGEDALAVARANVGRIAAPVAVELRRGSLLEPLAGESFTAIVANPPYVADAEYDALEPAVRAFEPELALRAGPDGLTHTSTLLELAGRHLAAGGMLALEIDSRRAEAVRGLAERAGWCAPRVELDVFGRPRFLLAFWE